MKPPTADPAFDLPIAPASPPRVTVAPKPQLGPGEVLFRTLGAAEIHVGGHTVIGPDAERMFSLLVVCAMSSGYSISRDRLMELVWPDMNDLSARHSLRQHLYRLRQLGIGVDGTRSVVALDRTSILPCFALTRTAELFDRDVLQGEEPFGHLFANWEPSHAGMQRWVESQRDVYHSDVRRILIPELRRLRDRGHWMEGERWARTVLEFDVFNEDATVVLAEAAAIMGSRISASFALDGYMRETGTIGTELARRIERAQQRILRANRVSHEDAATSTFVGRNDVLARLDRLMMEAMQGEARAIQILGPAGIGKTEAAYEATRHAVILGFSRCVVRASRPVGQVTHGTLARLTRDLLSLPGSLGCRPVNLRLLRQFAGLESTTSIIDVDDSTSASSLTECLLELIACISEEHPLFIFIDDLHYVDQHSLEEIDRILDLLQRQRVVFLTTKRDDLTQNAETQSERNIEIRLTPLGFEDNARLAESVETASGRRLDRTTAEQIARAGGSTPLEVVTIARELLVTGLTYTAAQSLQDTLRRQLIRLSDSARTLLAVLALAGGKASVAEIDHVLHFSLPDRARALRTVLESGLAQESSHTEIQCHDEVTVSVLSIFSHAELQLLRRHIARVFLERLKYEYSNDRAVIALSLAHTSGDSPLFIDAAVELAPALSDAGLFHGALRFLEHAKDLASHPAYKERVLECLVQTADKAADWSTVLLSANHLRRLADPSQSLSPKIILSELEASLQQELEDDGRKHARNALTLARSGALDNVERVRALRLVIASASDLFEADLAISAFSMLSDGTSTSGISHSIALEPQMQYHTIFGDLHVAKEIAEGIHQERCSVVDSPHGVRLLNNASHVLRVCGNLAWSRECMEVALSHPSVEESISRRMLAFWRLSLIEIDAGNKAAAIEWAERLFSMAPVSAEFSTDAWGPLHKLRIEHFTRGAIQDASLALQYALRPPTNVTRQQVYCTALALNSQQAKDDESLFETLLAQGVRCLTEYGRYTGHDYLALSLTESCSHRNRLQHVTEALETYFSRNRRDLSRVPVSSVSLTPEAAEWIIRVSTRSLSPASSH